MKFNIRHFDLETAALIEQAQKVTHFSIVEIGGPEDIKKWRDQQKIIAASQKIISDIKATQTRDRAIKIVEEHISQVQFDVAETAYKDARKPTKFDKLVKSMSGSRKRNFAKNEDL